jgi:peptidoglycan/xylan/chitin deacetylase (PgdA/CDA1 family)
VLLLIVAASILWRAIRGRAAGWRAVLRIALVGLVVIPLVLVSVWRLIKSREFQFFDGAVRRVEIASPLVALTFDDGPAPGFTEAVLQILRERGVRATFFVTGRELEENPAEGRSIVAEGHELGNHSYSHRRMVLRPYAFVRDEIERTDEPIRAAGYVGPIHFRPPYCARFILLPYYLDATERTTILMDVESESYPEIAADAGRIVAHVLDKARPGSIILLHVMYASRAKTREALPGIIDGLQEQGYRFVTVSELLGYGE